MQKLLKFLKKIKYTQIILLIISLVIFLIIINVVLYNSDGKHIIREDVVTRINQGSQNYQIKNLDNNKLSVVFLSKVDENEQTALLGNLASDLGITLDQLSQIVVIYSPDNPREAPDYHDDSIIKENFDDLNGPNTNQPLE